MDQEVMIDRCAIVATWVSIGLMALALSGCGTRFGGQLVDAGRAAAQCLPEFASCVVSKYKATQANVAP